MGLSEMIQEGGRVVSYGFSAAGYEDYVPRLMASKGIECLTYRQVEKDWSVDIYKNCEQVLKHAGYSAKVLYWQAGLVNVVLHNYMQIREGKPITPCLFCTHADELARPVSSTTIHQGSSPTSAEIRQAFQLCENPSLPQEIRDTAKKTFVFVQVHNSLTIDATQDLDAYFTELPLPWEKGQDYDSLCGLNAGAPEAYNRLKNSYREMWQIYKPEDGFDGQFWLQAVQRYLFPLVPYLPIYDTVGNLIIISEFQEYACVMKLVQWFAEHNYAVEALNLINGMFNPYNKSRGYEYLATAALKQGNRDKAVEFLDKIYSFDSQRRVVNMIVRYDLGQNPPDLNAAVDLVKKPYAGDVGIEDSRYIVEVALYRAEKLKIEADQKSRRQSESPVRASQIGMFSSSEMQGPDLEHTGLTQSPK